MSAKTAASLTARFVNATCWLISGVVLVVCGVAGTGSVWAVLIGLAMAVYGVYIAATRGAYWVSSVTYFLPVVAVALGVAALR